MWACCSPYQTGKEQKKYSALGSLVDGLHLAQKETIQSSGTASCDFDIFQLVFRAKSEFFPNFSRTILYCLSCPNRAENDTKVISAIALHVPFGGKFRIRRGRAAFHIRSEEERKMFHGTRQLKN